MGRQKTERNKEIVNKYLTTNYSMQQLANEYNLCRERISAILDFNLSKNAIKKIKKERAKRVWISRKSKILC